MKYVCDTHAFIFYITGKLSKSTEIIFRKAEEGKAIIFIPTIVLAECLYLAENKKIEVDFDSLLEKIEMSSNFIVVSFNFQILKLLKEIKLPELHDRIIVATAKILNAKVITKDEEIIKSKLIEVAW